MLTAYVPVPRNMSHAMVRVARALRRGAPRGVRLVDRAEDADLEVAHVIGADALGWDSKSASFAILQYCVGSAAGAGDASAWAPLWRRARLVASYYDLAKMPGAEGRFLHVPLGVDGRVFSMRGPGPRTRDVGVVTSGYMAGPGAEAIEEPAIAAASLGLTAFHVGPARPSGMGEPPAGWRSAEGLSDDSLARLYRRAAWVSGLRHVEGFELPVLEGLACGARPIAFDRADMRQWYEGHAVFVPEASGAALVGSLIGAMRDGPRPVTEAESEEILARFGWDEFARRFWAGVGAA